MKTSQRKMAEGIAEDSGVSKETLFPNADKSNDLRRRCQDFFNAYA
jgi:hypothetical protein